MLKVSIKYALICGVFLTIIYHVSYYLGSNPLIDISHLIFDVILFGLFIFFAEKEFKSYQSGGAFHFWQGMSIGFMIYTIATVLFGLALWVYLILSPDAVINYQEAATNFLNERAETYQNEFGADVLADQISAIQKITISDLVLSSSFKKLLAGFFVTPVISIILRNQRK